MDLMILIAIATALLVVLITLYFLQKRSETKDQQQARQQPQQQVRPDLNRRAQIARNQRNRLRQNVAGGVAGPANEERAVHANANANGGDNDSDGDVPQGAVLDEKMGAKKRAKLEAKEQKRQLREQELKMREERKVKEAKEVEVRKKQEELEAEDERKKEEAERLVREEQERKEYEEYLKIKATFSVEEEGYEEGDADEQANLLADFIKYIKDNKVVVLEDLGVEFKMKTQQVIDRIQELRENGRLTGVIDDRGKFIYVSEEEMAAVAKFIKQRGRVSIAELAECSNKLINLTPVVGS